MKLMPVSLPLLLLLTSTASPSQSPSPRPVWTGKAASACAAVTRSDVEDALGRPVGIGESAANSLQSTCDYSAGGGQVTVTLEHSTQKLDIAMEIEALKSNFPEASIRNVTGIGARAFRLDFPGAGTQLYVLRSDHDYLMVSVLGFGAAGQVSPAAEKMARRALARF